MIEQDKLALRVARIQAAAVVVFSKSTVVPDYIVHAACDLLKREFDEELRDETEPVHDDPATVAAGRDSV